MEILTIDTEQVKRFFNALWPGQDSGVLSFSCNGQNGLISKHFSFPLTDTAFDAISRWSERNVWFAIGLLGQRPEKGRGTADDVDAVPALVMDIDCQGGRHKEKNLPSKEEALAFLNEIPFKPSMLIWSGGGYQAYWIWTEMWSFDDTAGREQAKRLYGRWQSFIISKAKDRGWKLDNCGSIEHLFRVPGTFNHKAEPVPVEIVEYNGFRYSVEAIQEFLDDIPDDSQRQSAGPGVGSGTGRIWEIVEKCAFLKHCRDDAASLSEPHWWSMVCALCFEGGSRDAIHKLSERYPGYKPEEANKKILEALKQSGPMTCLAIREKTGFRCPSGGCGVKCPVHLLNGQRIEWEEPVLLDDFPVPAMKPVPGIIGIFSQAVSDATETPIELCQGLALAVVATAIHGRVEVLVKPGYRESVNVWVNVALESGTRKSAVHAAATRPLLTWEAIQREEKESAIRQAESERRNQEARLKSLRLRYGKAKANELAEIKKEILTLELSLVDVPVRPKVWVQDVTVEHLGTLMASHNERMSILSAEGGIFDLMAGRYSNGVPNLDLFLQSHSGDPIRVDRGSREPVFLERPALSMGLSTQPDVLRAMADGPGFRGRGLLARFLYSLPDSRLGNRSLETEPVSREVREQWEAVIHRLLNLKGGTDENGKEIPHIINLSGSAYHEWLEFSRVVEVELREGGRFEHIRDWAGKLPGAVARLAGLIHCVKCPYQPWGEPVALDTMQTALELGGVFSSHALKVFSLMGCDKSLDGARKVWRWIERSRITSFTKRDCYNSLKGSFPKVQDIEPVLDALEDRGYIAEVKHPSAVRGRPSVAYHVNPILVEGWR
jgi:hypothetical protein